MTQEVLSLVSTIKERCRVCYTCVRECPAKAIRIEGGQAEVIHSRCIGCGNCVRVCSQRAKEVLRSTAEVEALLSGERRVAACLAPSFPAEFTELDDMLLVGTLRAMGFDLVVEVAWGADLVARGYRELLESQPEEEFIATTCPAVVNYVSWYHPDSAPQLAPIVSPMVATARGIKQLYGQDLAIVFIGPCIAKKAEARDPAVAGEVDSVLTFGELRELMERRAPVAADVSPSEFDPPWAGKGALFPIARGLLQAAEIPEDLLLGKVIATDGHHDFIEGIKEFESGDLRVGLLEVLCCSGCIMGPGFTTSNAQFKRLAAVVDHARRVKARRGEPVADGPSVSLDRAYQADDRRIPVPNTGEVHAIMERMGKRTPSDELNCGACGYDTCREHAVAIYKGLAESEMCLPYTIEHLRETVEELGLRNDELASTQQALMHSEKLASMGQLAAGIAHEVNNPLGVVLLYTNLLLEQVPSDSPLREDIQMVVDQADRCRKIVAGLLDFSRQNKGCKQQADLETLLDRGLHVLTPPPGVEICRRRGCHDPTVELDPDQLIQILTNLVSNAYGAMPQGGVLTVSTDDGPEHVSLSVSDTGTGIRPEHLPRLYEPFFTTKPTGKGTGLGLPVTYGIVKMHRGDIRVETNADPAAGPTGTTFTVTLPRQAAGPHPAAQRSSP